ncbi:hypothetical protein M2404_002004 [Rheinheimera pacifica]|nr:hypothetical protein [Rheinheimera pacifica]
MSDKRFAVDFDTSADIHPCLLHLCRAEQTMQRVSSSGDSLRVT